MTTVGVKGLTFTMFLNCFSTAFKLIAIIGLS